MHLPFRHLHRLHTAGMVALVAVSIVGCRSFSPQVFSRQMSPSAGVAAPASPASAAAARRLTHPTNPSITEAIDRAEMLQADYAAAAREQASIAPTLGTALIGLGAYGLYKGVMGVSPTQVARAGAIGAGAYLAGDMLDSPPRTQVYLAGARMLSCATAITRPWGVLQQEAGTPENTMSLRQLISSTSDSAAKLNDLILAHRKVLQPTTMEEPDVAERHNATCRDPKPPCGTPPTGTEAFIKDWTAKCQRALALYTTRCTISAKKGTTFKMLPNAYTQAIFDRAEAAITEAGKRINTTSTGLDRLNESGGRLWDKTTDIEFRVASEVAKTIPDLNAVVGSLGMLRDLASRISGSDKYAPKSTGAGLAQSGNRTGREAETVTLERSDIPAEVFAVKEQTDALLSASAKLAPWVVRFDQAALSARDSLDACQLAAGAASLNVSPGEREIALRVGDKQEFYVSGGTGIPTGTSAGRGGSTGGSLVRDLDTQGNFRFTYSPPTGSKAGDVVDIEFQDASRNTRHSVTLSFVADGVPTTDPKAGPAPEGVDTNIWESLGFKLADKNKDNADKFTNRVRRCQGEVMKLPAEKITGVVDQTTQDFIIKTPLRCDKLG